MSRTKPVSEISKSADQTKLLDVVGHEWGYVDVIFCDGTSEIRSYKCKKCGMLGTSKAMQDGGHRRPEVRENCANHLLSSVMEK